MRAVRGLMQETELAAEFANAATEYFREQDADKDCYSFWSWKSVRGPLRWVSQTRRRGLRS